MLSKKYFASMTAAAFFLVGSLVVFAQTAQVRGKVEMKKADGTTEPVAGAAIDVYRTDAKGKFPSAKTNKKGEFAFAGLPLGQTFVLVASGEKVSAGMQPNVKAGMENIVISVSEGDGKKLTEEEVRAALSGNASPTTGNTANMTAAPDSANTAQQNTPAPQNTADAKKAQEEAKKAQAEFEKKKAEVEASNKKVTESNVLIKQVLDEGNKAYESKNYDLALAKYDEGINAAPDFIGSAPVLLNNKATVLVNRATENYNKAVKAGAEAKTAAMPTIKKDYEDAVVATDKSLTLLKTAPAGDAASQKNYESLKIQAVVQRKEAYRLMAKTGADRTKGKEAATAFQEYLALETEPKKKADAQLAYAGALQDSNEFDLAVAEFEKVLAQDANNIDALSGIGLSLVNVGYTSNDKVKFQQGANYLQKFVELAPDTHAFKDDAKGIIDNLKKEQNVAPQKVTKKKT